MNHPTRMIDTHNCLPSRTVDGFDIGAQTGTGHTDIARLKEGRGIDEEDARRRIAVQVSDEHRRANARWLVSNEGTLEDLAAKVGVVWPELLALNAKVM